MSGYFTIMGCLDWVFEYISPYIPQTKQTIELTCGRGELIWHRPKCGIEIMNDKDEHLIRLHRIVASMSDEDVIKFSRSYNFILDKDTYDKFRQMNTKILSDFDFLYNYLYLFYGGKSGDEVFKDVFLPTLQGKTFSTVISRIRESAYRLRDVEFVNMDAIEVFDKYNSTDSFFFIDPPYPSRERYYRIHDLDWSVLCSRLINTQAKWMVVCDITLSPRVGTTIRNKDRVKYILNSHNSLIQLLAEFNHMIFTENFKMGFKNLNFDNRKKVYAVISNLDIEMPKQLGLF